MRQLADTMLISKNRLLFHFWWKKSSVKHRKVPKYYETDCRCFHWKGVSGWYLNWSYILSDFSLNCTVKSLNRRKVILSKGRYELCNLYVWKSFLRSFYLFGFQHQNFYKIFFNMNLLAWETLIEAISLVISAIGSQICISGTILTRIKIFL